MSNGLFGDITFLALSKALDGLSLRHEVISNNIANVNTPGFKAGEVSFEEALKSALEEGEAALARFRPRVEVAPLAYRVDQNSVDIDREMGKLADNALTYNAVAELISARFRILGMAISEGRR
ncbi:MAG: flagellar basal body rod protein FlgB [Firmicutes bacterium]|nr:flagellar basal body rod protein FlgB [Bacillota bacterium]